MKLIYDNDFHFTTVREYITATVTGSNGGDADGIFMLASERAA